MNIQWFKYFSTKQEKEEFKELALANKRVFSVLRKILEDKVESIRREKTSPKTYALPAWSEFQADKNGEERTLQWVIDLLPEE